MGNGESPKSKVQGQEPAKSGVLSLTSKAGRRAAAVGDVARLLCVGMGLALLATFFAHNLWVLLPILTPALLTGFALAFARAVGEYGSVIFIAGNLPNVSEIAPLLIVIRLSEFRYADATAIAVVMLVASFLIIFAVNRLQRWAQLRIPAH